VATVRYGVAGFSRSRFSGSVPIRRNANPDPNPNPNPIPKP